MDSYTFYTIILNLCIKAYFIKVGYLSLHPPVLSLFTHMLIDTATQSWLSICSFLYVLSCFLNLFIDMLIIFIIHLNFCFTFNTSKILIGSNFKTYKRVWKWKIFLSHSPWSPNSCLWRPTILSVSLSFQSVLYSIYLGGGEKNWSKT